MSMTVKQQSPTTTWSFDEDSSNGKLVSLNGLTHSAFGAYAPGPVEISSSSSPTKNGVVRANITVRVPLVTFDQAGQPTVSVGQNKPKFAQVGLTVALPNTAGIIGSTDNASGVPKDQAAANLAAISLGMSLLAALTGGQATMTAGDTLFMPAFTTGQFDAHNPIARGLSGVIPVDPNANRDLQKA